MFHLLEIYKLSFNRGSIFLASLRQIIMWHSSTCGHEAMRVRHRFLRKRFDIGSRAAQITTDASCTLDMVLCSGRPLKIICSILSQYLFVYCRVKTVVSVRLHAVYFFTKTAQTKTSDLLK